MRILDASPVYGLYFQVSSAVFHQIYFRPYYFHLAATLLSGSVFLLRTLKFQLLQFNCRYRRGKVALAGAWTECFNRIWTFGRTG